MTEGRPGATFRETNDASRFQAVPLAHLSLELGHLAAQDFEAGPERLREHFDRVRPWADAARTAAATAGGPRVSTCFLVDDYGTSCATPAKLLPAVLAEAERAGLGIDYLARESGCDSGDGIPVAEGVAARIVEAPVPGTDGSRPPVVRTGWLANGRRSAGTPDDTGVAPADAVGWRPPAETTARSHSVFLDAELWSRPAGGRVWSCSFLAAVWQLARLGLLRHLGGPVLQPTPWPPGKGFPDDWDVLPPVIRVNSSAAPFSAYRTCSVLPSRLLPVEHAVRVVLEQVAVEPRAFAQVSRRALSEGVPVPDDVHHRITYAFYEGP
ncbi:SCO2522 family protein [Streptomyces zhihengii]|uniref:SCO2522 family protein n=1 Tax=Streptomyces zhihengii TaxID=1818004 RepID=UPI0034566ADF